MSNFVFVFIIVFQLIRSCLLKLLKLFQGHKSLEWLFDGAFPIYLFSVMIMLVFVKIANQLTMKLSEDS